VKSASGSPVQTVAVETLGCRLNLFESDGILQQFSSSGRYTLIDAHESADVVIINTCTVTDQADQKNRALINKTLRRNPQARVIVTGCYAQTDPEEILSIPGVFMVIGNDRKTQLLKLFEEKLVGTTPEPTASSVFDYGLVLPNGNTRAYLKIQDGCDRKCTYCKIPQARGEGVSRSLRDVLDHVMHLESRGIPEIVLTGVNLGWYRSDGIRFGALVRKILEVIGKSRLRLSSIEPCDVDEELAEISLHPRFCNFLHVPLQSGSRTILKRMRRTYNPESFRKRLLTVLRRNPDIFLGTDVITGFPGETEQDFKQTVELCEELGMANIHAFPFSPRRGTLAADYDDRPDAAVVHARMEELKALKAKGYAQYASRFVGRKLEGVVEKPDAALSDNFLRLTFEECGARRGELRWFEVDSVQDGVVYSIPR